MRSIWNGAIGFGLVNIPIKLYSASESSSLDLDMLDKRDLSNIKFKRVNEKSGKEVDWENIVKGYKLEDRYIAEFTAANPNVTINVTRQSAEKLIELVQTAFAAGQGPTVFNLSVNDEYPYIAAGRVAPMNYQSAGYKNADDVKASYAPKMLDPVTYDGEVYGLPLELTNWCIYINKRDFIDAGLDP